MALPPPWKALPISHQNLSRLLSLECTHNETEQNSLLVPQQPSYIGGMPPSIRESHWFLWSIPGSDSSYNMFGIRQSREIMELRNIWNMGAFFVVALLKTAGKMVEFLTKLSKCSETMVQLEPPKWLLGVRKGTMITRRMPTGLHIWMDNLPISHFYRKRQLIETVKDIFSNFYSVK